MATQVYDELALLKSAQSRADLKFHLVDHPLVRQSLAAMRDQATDMTSFRAAVAGLTPLLVYEATKDLPEQAFAIHTPLSPIKARRVKPSVVLIPVLRSGVGMLAPTQRIFPSAPTIFAGMARDEATAIAHWYLDLKDLKGLNSGKNAVFLVLDPMLATGGSALETIKRIKSIYPHGTIKLVVMIAAPEGIKAINQKYPEVAITTAAVDDHLNKNKYIVPGLGDAGDRQFGT